MSTVTGSTPGKIRTFLLDHERLIIVVIFAALCWWGYGKYADIRLQHDNSVLAQQTLITNAATAAAKSQAAQSAQDAAALQALQTKLEAQNAQLVLANTQMATALASRQHVDAVLPLPDLATRWTSLVPAAHPAATANGLSVDSDSAHATVATLEQVPVLQSELANETTLKANDDLLLTQQSKNIFDLNAQVTGLTKLDADHQAQCVDEKNVMKSEFRKSKRHWFVAGVVVGFIGRQLIKVETGW
jgi:hypothetical protein